MLFDGWNGLLRVLLVGALAYCILVGVRVSGKRTLAKMNAFDLLAALHFVVAWSWLRFRTVESIAKSSPRILLSDGAFLRAAMRDERVTAEEVAAAVRGAGIGDLAAVAAVVLETNGSLSIIAQSKAGARTAWPKERVS